MKSHDKKKLPKDLPELKPFILIYSFISQAVITLKRTKSKGNNESRLLFCKNFIFLWKKMKMCFY